MAELLLLSALAMLAYYQIFSVYAFYDDEGYLMLTVKHFLAGHRLYDEVWTLYGPVYFFYKWLIHGLCGLPLTHDVVRLTAIAVRILTGVAAAVSAFRLTGSVALAASSQMLVTFHLVAIDMEPGHPQELSGLLTMALVAIASFASGRRRRRMAIALGLVIAALSMVKINLGAFAGLAVWMAFLSQVPLTRASAALRIVSSAALIALPWVLMRSLLGEPTAQHFAATEALAVLAFSTIALTRRDGTSSQGDLVALASAWAGGVALMVLAPYVSGTTLAALVDSLVVSPSRMPALFVHMPPESFPSPLPAIAAVALAVGLRATEHWRISPHVVGLAKLSFGVATLAAWRPVEPTVLLSGFTPFLWLGILAPAGAREDAARRLARLVLCWVAVLQPLQAFPVAGSQVNFGTVMHVIVAAVCLADATAWLRSLSGALARPALHAAVAGIVLLVVTSVIVWQLSVWRAVYAASVPVDLPGAARLRLPARQVSTLHALTQILRERADTFLCVPGFSSLYFWTGKEPPTLDVVGHEMRFYSDERQAAMVSALLQHRSPMVVRFRGLAAPYPPFEERLRQSFTPLKRIEKYQLLVRR